MNVGDYSRGRDQGGDIKEQETPWHIAGCLPSRGSQTGATREMRLERSPTVPCKVQSEKQLARPVAEIQAVMGKMCTDATPGDKLEGKGVWL